ncbi:MAG TPA: hypothetical protein VF094_12375 [Gaiellaceae bacterium]
MTADDRRALRDQELVELLAEEPELLAISDAYAATQHRYWFRGRVRARVWRLGLLAAILLIVGIPSAAFADQIGQLLGLSNSGTPVPIGEISARQLSALESLGFPLGQVRFLAHRADVSFYAAKTGGGSFCFAIGLRQEPTPSIDALACQGGTIGSFPSPTKPVADFSTVNATTVATYVTTLAGFATDDVARVGVLDASGKVIYSAPVEKNVYAADDVPQTPAVAIVAFNDANTIVYRKELTPPPAPQPATP